MIDIASVTQHYAQLRLTAVRAEEERRAREAVHGWLPKGLKWMVDHPKLLKFYVHRLPHRTIVVAVQEQGRFGPSEFVVKKRSEVSG